MLHQILAHHYASVKEFLPVSPVEKSRQSGISALAPFDSTLLQRLPPSLARLLVQIVRLAIAQEVRVWLVAGVVRDLLLDLPLKFDIDLAIEGDAAALAETVAMTLGGRVVASHQAFGTATIELVHEGRPLTLDFAMTRCEMYTRPTALPVVVAANIYDDLARRDFSLNALAIELRLDPQDSERLTAGQLLDRFNGYADLAAGQLRVLHDQSFRDDPTRILRGLRQAARLALVFAPHTRQLLQEALDAELLEATTPERVRSELCLALEEPDPGEVLYLSDQLNVTPHIFAPLAAVPPEIAAGAADPSAELLVRAGLLTYHLTSPEREALIKCYRLPNVAARLLRDVATLKTILPTLNQPELAPSALDQLLHPFSSFALDVLRYTESHKLASKRVQTYATTLQKITPTLTGHDLQRLGVAPGPTLGDLLRALRAARLDGLVTDRASEEQWVRQQIAGTV